MSEIQPTTIQKWIEREFAIFGVLAAGGGNRHGQVCSSFASGELVMAGNEDVWRCVAETIAVLQSKGAPAGELLWGFENAVLCTVQREDGAWLGVFTVADLKDEPALVLRSKLDAFRQEQFAA